jgi:SPP1 family predicted phage head-tail adaptor
VAISTDLLRHTLVIERATNGSPDERGVPAQTWATLATIKGSIQPLTSLEVAQLTQGGPVASTHKAYIAPTDILEGDRVRADGILYQIDGIDDEAGWGHHLKLNLHAVT